MDNRATQSATRCGALKAATSEAELHSLQRDLAMRAILRWSLAVLLSRRGLISIVVSMCFSYGAWTFLPADGGEEPQLLNIATSRGARGVLLESAVAAADFLVGNVFQLSGALPTLTAFTFGAFFVCAN